MRDRGPEFVSETCGTLAPKVSERNPMGRFVALDSKVFS
jgi:hypothetical protein